MDNLIAGERAQEAEKVLFYHRNGAHCDPFESKSSSSADPRMTSGGASNSDLKMYQGPKSSSETPMQRQMTLSPMNDPHPWLAKAAMRSAGIHSGDLETADARRTAARRINPDTRSDIAEETAEGELIPTSEVRRRKNIYKDNVCRVEKRVRKRKRTTEDEKSSH